MAESRSRHESDFSGISQASLAKDPSDDIQPVRTISHSLPPRNSDDPEFVNGKRVLREEDAFEKTAYAWSPRKKWMLLTIVAICQTSMLVFPVLC
jgi:hypothetical protein